MLIEISVEYSKIKELILTMDSDELNLDKIREYVDIIPTFNEKRI